MSLMATRENDAARWIAAIGALLLLICGGRASRAQDAAGATTTRVSGVVFDSLSMRPLVGAVVQLVSTTAVNRARTVQTGATGSYVFDSLEQGSYLLAFYHAVVDSMGLSLPLARIDIRVPGDVRVPLAVPSAATIVARVCGPSAARDSTGVLMGYVRSALGGTVAGPAQVTVQWSEITVSAKSVQRTTPSLQVTTGDEGAFAICGVPTSGPVLARAWAGPDSSGFVDLDVPSNGLLRRDLLVGRATLIAVRRPPDSLGAEGTRAMPNVLRGKGALRGEIRGPAGDPIAGARLMLWGSGVEVESNENGRFAMQELPAGTYTLEARAIGFLPLRRAVDLSENEESVAPLTLESFGTFLDTVRVNTTRLYTSPQLAEFERRKRSGFGYFLDEEAIAKRNPMYMSDLFRMTPGLTISAGQSFGDVVLMRGTGFQSYCVPALFMDGMRVFNSDGVIDQIVNPQDVRAVEIYTRASNIPPQFNTLEGCGAIVVWTGGRRRR